MISSLQEERIGDHFEESITLSRAVVLAWVCRELPGNYATNEELAKAFCSMLPPDAELELQTTRNPSALVCEARWYHRGRELEEFSKPFCAESEGDARVLACAAILALDGR